MDSVLLMIRSNFLSAANRLELEQCLRRHREEHGMAHRANAILLLDKGKPCAEIAEFLYLDDDTIRSWYKVFRQEGWDALAHDGWQGWTVTPNLGPGNKSECMVGRPLLPLGGRD
jgi:hypothetical protein